MNEKWDRRFLELAFTIAAWSKDPSTQTGAVILSDHISRRPLSFGYNGPPRGIDDTAIPTTRPEKYLYFEHAERNAIYNARTPLDGATLYCTHRPCADCARAVIQTGIIEVVTTPDLLHSSTHLQSSQEAAARMLHEAGVLLRVIDLKSRDRSC